MTKLNALCEKVLGNLFSFYRHKKNQHTTQKKKKTAPKVFKCSQCPREFSTLWKLQRHEPVHTKVNFTCGKCGKCFSRSSWYNKHGLTCSGEQYVPSDDNEADEVDFYNFYEKEDFNDEHNDNDDSSKDDNEDPFNNETDETYDIQLDSYCNVAHDVLESADVSISLHNSDFIFIQDAYGDVSEMPVVMQDENQSSSYTHSQELRNYNRKCKALQRKKDKLCEVISRFGHLKDIEKKAIINKSCDETNIQLDNEPENYLQENEFGQRMLQSLKGLTCNSIKNRDRFCGSLHLVYGNDLMKDDETLSWLAKELDAKPHRLKTLMENWLHVDSDNRGKHRALTTETKNAIFACWTLNSIVTVDRKNGRDVALMKKSEYDENMEKLMYQQTSLLRKMSPSE